MGGSFVTDRQKSNSTGYQSFASRLKRDVDISGEKVIIKEQISSFLLCEDHRTGVRVGTAYGRADEKRAQCMERIRKPSVFQVEEALEVLATPKKVDCISLSTPAQK